MKPPWLEFKEKEYKEKMEKISQSTATGHGFNMKQQNVKMENLQSMLNSGEKISQKFQGICHDLGFSELKTLDFLIDFYLKNNGVV